MITEHDLHEAIAECQGERNPNAQTCIKLAAYYTILHELTDKPIQPEYPVMYSADPAGIDLQSDSEFAEVVRGRDPAGVWEIIDELMQTLSVVNPRLYASVMRKLEDWE